MAKDDYHVIVHQILAYLYQRLKKGEDVEPEMLSPNSPILKCWNVRYWSYIFHHLFDGGLITGITLITMDGMNWKYPTQLENCMITPDGIDYLTENSNMKKAVAFLKDVREIVPFQL